MAAIELTSERLLVREMAPEDWPAVHEWASRPEACRYQTWGPNTPEETQAFVGRVVAAAAAEPRTEFTLLAQLRDTGRVVGSGSLFVRSQQFGTGEVAYIVHPDNWGQGIASEMAAALVGWGFAELGLHRVFGTCDPRNVASARVLRKLGMTHEGRMRHTALIRDGWRDSELYAVLEHEWRARPSSS
jgi:ribosomal-protein-alanine N-acetyltransferase